MRPGLRDQHDGRWNRWCAGLFGVLAGVVAAASSPVAAQEVWFGPLEPRAPHTGITGAADWPLLLRPDAPWARAAAATALFHITPGFVADASDERLLALKAAMEARHVGFAISIQPVAAVPAEDHCGATEGYDDPRNAVFVASKLRRLGIVPAALSLDGPLWFGHYGTGAQECRFPVAEVVTRTARLLRIYLETFPGLRIGDVEGIPGLVLQPGWQAAYQGFLHGLEAAIGRKVGFLQLDVNWRDPGWPRAMATIKALTDTAGMQLGIIYNSDDRDESNTAWLAQARRNFEIVESREGIIPNQAVFVSWNRFPDHIMPDTSPAAHSWLINQYQRPRTRIALTAEGPAWRGRLTGAAGEGIPNAVIAVDAMGLRPGQSPTIRTATGTVPDKARAAIIGLRINQECGCSGDNDLMFGALHYQEQPPGGVAMTYDFPAIIARSPPRPETGLHVAPTAIAGGHYVHLRVEPGQRYGFNSAIFDVTPGAAFAFTVPIGSVTGTGMFGNATIIWLDAKGQGITRTNLLLEQDIEALPPVTTDATGDFVIIPPTDRPGTPWLRLHYAGTDTRRGAYAAVGGPGR